jgi:hypothetical protein
MKRLRARVRRRSRRVDRFYRRFGAAPDVRERTTPWMLDDPRGCHLGARPPPGSTTWRAVESDES